MKIYLAARYTRYKELQIYRDIFATQGHEVTSRWINGNHQVSDDGLSAEGTKAQREQFAKEDWEDLLASDTIVAFTEPPRSEFSRGGRHVEWGIALALQKRCICVGPAENIFYCLPQVLHFPNWALCSYHFERERMNAELR